MSRIPWKGDFRTRVKIQQNSLEFSILDAFYGFKKVWFFHCSPPQSFQSEKYRLTWDGKCEKFSVLKPRGGIPDFKWQGWSNGGKNQNPKISLDQNLSPKKSHAEFPSHNKNFQGAYNDITRKMERLVLNTQNNPSLYRAAPFAKFKRNFGFFCSVNHLRKLLGNTSLLVIGAFRSALFVSVF